MKKLIICAVSLLVLSGLIIYRVNLNKMNAELRVARFLDDNEVEFELVNHGKSLYYSSWMSSSPGEVEMNINGHWVQQSTGSTCGLGTSSREIKSGSSVFFTKKPYMKEGRWRLSLYLREKDMTPEWLRSTLQFLNINYDEPEYLELITSELNAVKTLQKD